MTKTELLEANAKDRDAEFETFRKKPVTVKAKKMLHSFTVKTLGGVTEGRSGDYLIKGVNGELYPCARDIFHKTYQSVQ